MRFTAFVVVMIGAFRKRRPFRGLRKVVATPLGAVLWWAFLSPFDIFGLPTHLPALHMKPKAV
jgi:hypothetical protein